MDAAADASRVVKPFGFAGLCLSLVGIAALALVATTLIAGVMAGIAGLALGWSGLIDAVDHALAQSDDPTGTRALFAMVLAVYLGFAIAIVTAAKWRGKSQWRDLIGWRPFRLSDRIVWAIMVATLIYSASADAAISHFLPHPAARLTVPADRLAAAELFVLAVVLAPVTEELLFRGWIYTSLRCHWGLWPALLTTSALFALAHYEGTHVYALAVFPIGLALGAIRERTGSIKASITYHAINNCAAFCLSALSGN